MNPPTDDANRQCEWRCVECAKLLGNLLDGRLHLRLTRGHTYLVGFPATTVCLGCRTINELASPSSLAARTSSPQER